MEAVEFGPLDSIVPPCYVSVTWLAKAFARDAAVAALSSLVSENFAFLLGRAMRDKAGRWHIVGPPRETVSVEDVAEQLSLGDLVNVPFEQWPAHNLVTFLDASPNAETGLVGGPLLHLRVVTLQDGFAVTVFVHHNVADGKAFFDLLALWSRRVHGLPLPELETLTMPASVVLRPAAAPEGLPVGLSLVRPSYTYPYPPMHTVRLRFAAARMKTDCEGAPGVTRNDCVCAALWSAMSHCRGIAGASSVTVAVDVRRHLSLAPEARYFGNAICYAEAAAEGARDRPLSELAVLVRAAITGVTPERVATAVQWISQQEDASKIVSPGARVALSSGMLISNWSRFSLLSDAPFAEPPLFAAPVMPSVFRGLDGIAIICGGRQEDGDEFLDALVGIESSKAPLFLAHPLVNKYATSC